MPEVTLGVAPAQIAPFVARRIGAPRARWLMLRATKLDADGALAAGLADVVDAGRRSSPSPSRRNCARWPSPSRRALRATKRLVTLATSVPLGEALDGAALEFARAAARRRGARRASPPRANGGALPGTWTCRACRSSHDRRAARPGRQPRRDRRPHRAHGAPARHRDRRGLFRRRPRRAARARVRRRRGDRRASRRRRATCAIDRILEAARIARADAIHPGYGFLAENAAFAAGVEAAGLTFIGPPSAAIAAMGDKARARRRMAAAGIPVAARLRRRGAGRADLARSTPRAIGYPVMVKAAAGGGGRGMRLVHAEAELAAALRAARLGGREGVRRRAPDPRARAGRAAPRRDPGARRPARPRDPPR